MIQTTPRSNKRKILSTYLFRATIPEEKRARFTIPETPPVHVGQRNFTALVDLNTETPGSTFGKIVGDIFLRLFERMLSERFYV